MRARSATAVVMFDVVYEDGSRSSNRRVPATALGGLDGDDPARAIIEAQDRERAAASGRPVSPIKSLSRTPIKVANDDATPRKLRGQR